MSEGPKHPTGKGARAERLAAALKANLHKRKAQARERARADTDRAGTDHGKNPPDAADAPVPLAKGAQKDD